MTPTEIHRLFLSDAAEDAQRVGQGRGGGRPRSAPNTPRQERARQRALARYYRLKEQRHAPPE